MILMAVPLAVSVWETGASAAPFRKSAIFERPYN